MIANLRAYVRGTQAVSKIDPVSREKDQVLLTNKGTAYCEHAC
jgi:hypothetical protein